MISATKCTPESEDRPPQVKRSNHCNVLFSQSINDVLIHENQYLTGLVSSAHVTGSSCGFLSPPEVNARISLASTKCSHAPLLHYAGHEQRIVQCHPPFLNWHEEIVIHFLLRANSPWSRDTICVARCLHVRSYKKLLAMQWLVLSTPPSSWFGDVKLIAMLWNVMEKPLARQAGVVTGRMLLYDLSSAAIQKGTNTNNSIYLEMRGFAKLLGRYWRILNRFQAFQLLQIWLKKVRFEVEARGSM